jgi:hypothetical protein
VWSTRPDSSWRLAKVRIEGLPYDEFVHIFQVRLILTIGDARAA